MTLAIVAVSLGLYALKQKIGLLKFSFSLLLFALLSTLIVSLVLKGNNRFSGAVYHLQNQEKRDNTSIESTTARILLWETSIELIKEKPIFGFGTGDIKDVLRARNYEKGYTGVADADYNAHNQFLNSWIAIGVLGTLCLLLVFLTLFNQPNSAHLLFTRYTTIIFFFMFLTESFLEVQSGILPFAFLVSILSTIKKPHYPSF
jgi:O-antigen ligase